MSPYEEMEQQIEKLFDGWPVAEVLEVVTETLKKQAARVSVNHTAKYAVTIRDLEKAVRRHSNY